jgi:hypothetical protein
MRRTTIGLLLSLLLATSITACEKAVVPPTRAGINVTFDVKVTDPDLQRLAAATDHIELVARGQFAPGTYEINHRQIKFEPDTAFILKLALPITDATVIHSADATGSLYTSRPFSAQGIELPQTIDLAKGKVSGDVDIVRTLGAFFVSFLQKTPQINDVRQIIESIHVDNATMRLRQDSVLEMDKQRLHVGDGSYVTLQDLSVDSDLNYNGVCKIKIKFLDGCSLHTDTSSCAFDGGKAEFELAATKINDRMNFSLKPGKRRAAHIELGRSRFSFGKNLQSSASAEACEMMPETISAQFIVGAKRPHLHMVSAMELKHPSVDWKTDVQITKFAFKGSVPATLQIDQDEGGIVCGFATTDTMEAESGQIVISKRNSTLTVLLTNASIGPTSLDKSGALAFSLEHGSARLKQLEWAGKKGKFSLVTDRAAAIDIPDGLQAGRQAIGAPARFRMPVDIRLGTASLKGSSGTTELTNIDGKLLIDVDKEVELTGDMDFRLPDSHALDGETIDVAAHGLRLAIANGVSIFHLDKCSVVIPQGAVQRAINRKLPDTMTIKLNKLVMPQETWRYRNGVVKTATIKGLELKHMQPKKDELSFTATGDIEIDGTVDQQQKKLLAKDTNGGDWQPRDWQLFGHFDDEGSVGYKFIKQEGTRNQHQISYDLNMNFPVPSDTHLDWSKVANGIMGYVERQVIVRHLRKMTVPIHYGGTVAIFPDNSIGRGFKVSHLVAKHIGGNTQLDFVADAKFGD